MCWYLFFSPLYGLSLNSHVHLKRVCILWLLNLAFYRCLLGRVGCIYCSNLQIYILNNFYILFLSITAKTLLKSLTIIVCLFLPFVLSALFQIFWGFVIWYIHFYDCYEFLINCSLIIMKWPLFLTVPRP